MKHTIELPDSLEVRLQETAKRANIEAGAAIATLVAAFLMEQGHSSANVDGWVKETIDRSHAQIKASPNVVGGDACIRDTRIQVWALIDYKRQGLDDLAIVAAFPGLTEADLAAAWSFYAANADVVDGQRKRHEEAA